MSASYEVLNEQNPYLQVRVLFDDLFFDQWLIVSVTGDARAERLQQYADDYATEWRAAQTGA